MRGYRRLSRNEDDANDDYFDKLGQNPRYRDYHRGRRSGRPDSQRWILAVQAAVLLANIFLVTWNLGLLELNNKRTIEQPFCEMPVTPWRLNQGRLTSTTAPARSSVRYVIEQSDAYSMHASPFIGEPRLELDQAWSSLLEFTNIRISEDEMRTMNKTSVALKDGDGYLGYLEVHHMLHCLKRFKQFRHLEHYSEIDPSTYDLPHWDHCIEVIRRGIMCNADLMIDTLEWNEDGSYLNGVNRYPRVCADWDSVQEFAAARSIEVDHFDPLEKFWPNNDWRSVGPDI